MQTSSGVRLPLLVATLAFLLTACSAPTEEPGDDAGVHDAEATDSSAVPSHVSAAVEEALDRPRFEPWRGRLLAVSPDGSLPDDWIFEVPPPDRRGETAEALEAVTACDEDEPDCDSDFRLLECSSDDDCHRGGSCDPVEATVTSPDDTPRSLCTGHSQQAYELVYETIAEAEDLVDVTTLYPPDGPFEAAIQNGLAYLDASGSTATVRFQFGSIIFDSVDVDETLDELTRRLSDDPAIDVGVGTHRDGIDSWNHAKIAAVDGRTALVGGMNLSAGSYLREAPVFDLSMRVQAPMAGQAHRFADELWRFVCNGEFVGEAGLVDYATTGDLDCPTGLAKSPTTDGDGDVWTASIGRLGAIGANPADEAVLAALGAAEDSIRLSVQDLGPMPIGPLESESWPTELLDVLARAMTEGVEIEVLMTTPVVDDAGGGSDDEGAYSNGWTERDAIDRLEARLAIHEEWLPDETTPSDVICQHLNIAPIRPYDRQAWPGGAEFANHAKSFIVDDRAFYIGSQNLYPADLAEFGYLIDDAETTDELLRDYWQPLWSSSQPGVVDGCD